MIINNESPAAAPVPFDNGKTETLPPVPIPEDIPQHGQEQQQQLPESQNPTLELPGSQVEMFAPLTGTEGCTAALPQVNPEEWDANVGVIFYLMLLLLVFIVIISHYFFFATVITVERGQGILDFYWYKL